MKVLILEDVIEHQVRLERILNEISEESNIPISYKTTGKVREFKEYIENDEVNQLYFLDIDIHGIEKKGFEVAQFIRHHNPYAIIVFITSRSEFATLTYKYQVSALDFVDKDINDELFKKRIEQSIFYTKSMLLENEDVVDYFDYNYKGNDLKIPYHDILYIETTGVSHKLRIIGKNFSKEFYGTMTDIQEKDKHTQRFYCSHKSFLVNVGNVREIDRKNLEVVFYEDHRCPITRLKVRKLKDILEKKSKK
ncbi:competence system response regulator transcription factor ComE [Streptococcus oralis]|uniref:competence system response regulator transcription factor ComE n=1 Tax=Streptococcus oralis TaxID=1303 RepID=UPI001BD4D017|nr:competence system response regulator transcription factor ComE [Streptococcus oralis]MBS9401370.1 response regulator transcription factor [Streptococcus oralis]